jgi:hypothetical protein
LTPTPNAGWQRDLSLSHERIGDVGGPGDLPKSLKSFHASLAIRQRL